MKKLPAGWSDARLEEFADVILGQSPPGDSYNDQGVGLPFFQGKAEFGDLRPTIRKWTTEPRKVAIENDVLLSVRAPVGPTNLAPCECVVGRGLAAIRPLGGIDSSYVLYGLRTTADTLASRATGTTFAAVSGSQVRSHVVPLAPLNEQRRIVAAIEEQFSRLDSAHRWLESAERKLESLFVASLRERFALASAQELTVDELCDRIVDCEHSTPKFWPSGLPCVDTTCIKPGQIIHTRLRYVDEVTFAQRVRRLNPSEGDVIFAREGTVGTAVLVPARMQLCLGQRVMLLRPGSRVLPKFLEQILNSPIARAQYEPLILGTTAPHLNVRDIKQLRIPVPSLDEQRRIVAEAEHQSSLLAALSIAIDSAGRRGELLRRSILERAFRGELVQQDPTDEPASALLGRLATERPATGQKTRRRVVA